MKRVTEISQRNYVQSPLREQIGRDDVRDRFLYLPHNNSAQIVTKFGQNLVHLVRLRGSDREKPNQVTRVTSLA